MMPYSPETVFKVRSVLLMTQAEFGEHFRVSRRQVIRWEQTGITWRSYSVYRGDFEKLAEKAGVKL